MLVRHDFARGKAKMLLKGCKTPVDVEKIADRLGIKYHYHCIPEVDYSFSLKCGNQYIIGILITGNQEADNRAFARQIGHIVLGHFELYEIDSLEEDRLSDHNRQLLIQEAEVFADELLISVNQGAQLGSYKRQKKL